MAEDEEGEPFLADKYKVFADGVLLGKNATQAARDAGYTGGNVGVSANRLLKRPDVQRYLAFKRAQTTENLSYDVTKWKGELIGLAHSNVQDFTRLNDDGDLEVDFSRATREQLAAISGVKVKKRKIYDNKGNVVGEEHQSEFKLWDKLRAAELLGKHAGFLAEPDQKIVVDVADRLLRARGRIMNAGRLSSDDGGVVIEGGGSVSQDGSS